MASKASKAVRKATVRQCPRMHTHYSLLFKSRYSVYSSPATHAACSTGAKKSHAIRVQAPAHLTTVIKHN